MDKDKIKKELLKLLSEKKINKVLIALLAIIFLLIVISVLKPESNEEDKKIFNNAEEVVSNLSDYEERETKELINILEKMEGVGKVAVKINFESDEVKVPAYESTTQTSTTEEEDNGGGTRVNEQTNESTSIVKSDDEPYILKTNKPNIIGIAVVAEGASDKKVKQDIEKIICNIYNLPINKVNVYPMK